MYDIQVADHDHILVVDIVDDEIVDSDNVAVLQLHTAVKELPCDLRGAAAAQLVSKYKRKKGVHAGSSIPYDARQCVAEQLLLAVSSNTAECSVSAMKHFDNLLWTCIYSVDTGTALPVCCRAMHRPHLRDEASLHGLCAIREFTCKELAICQLVDV